MTRRPRELFNVLTHLAGAVLAAVGLVVLAWMAIEAGKTKHLLGFVIFGVSMIALYTSSALYHMLPLPASGVSRLRQLDHMMIYVLIAGTYTPICLVALGAPWGWGMLSLVWCLAVGGIIFKLRWMHAPAWLSPSLYLLMGWVGVVAAPEVYRSIHAGGVVWIVVGGIVYTIGVLVLALRRPNLLPGGIGSHELWHLLVLAGNACHFWVMVRYIAPLG